MSLDIFDQFQISSKSNLRYFFDVIDFLHFFIFITVLLRGILIPIQEQS